MSDTGFPKGARNLIDGRSGGQCEVQTEGCTVIATQRHHRRCRGSGGTRLTWVNRAGNGLHVCLACHAHIESYRTEAMSNGWLVSMNRTQKSSEIPVQYRGRAAFLDDAGDVHYQGELELSE